MSWKHAVAVLILTISLAANLFATERFGSAEYFAATAGGQKRAEAGVKGTLVFDPNSKQVEFLNQNGVPAFTIHYDAIRVMQYEKTGRPRYVAAVFISPVFLLTSSKKRYLTIEYDDPSGKACSVIVRLNKRNAGKAIATATAETSKSVEQIEEK